MQFQRNENVSGSRICPRSSLLMPTSMGTYRHAWRYPVPFAVKIHHHILFQVVPKKAVNLSKSKVSGLFYVQDSPRKPLKAGCSSTTSTTHLLMRGCVPTYGPPLGAPLCRALAQGRRPDALAREPWISRKPDGVLCEEDATHGLRVWFVGGVGAASAIPGKHLECWQSKEQHDPELQSRWTTDRGAPGELVAPSAARRRDAAGSFLPP